MEACDVRRDTEILLLQQRHTGKIDKICAVTYERNAFFAVNFHNADYIINTFLC